MTTTPTESVMACMQGGYRRVYPMTGACARRTAAGEVERASEPSAVSRQGRLRHIVIEEEILPAAMDRMVASDRLRGAGCWMRAS